jgi:hypothetical protein
MRKSPFDKRIEKAILRMLDGLVTKHGIKDVSHAVSKWNRARLVRNSVNRERRKLRERLAELEAKR